MMISLNGANYHLWKSKMEDMHFVNEFHVHEFKEKKLNKKMDDEGKLLHRQICGLTEQWIDDNLLHYIETETNARSLQKKLEQLYARKTSDNKMYLIKKLIELRYQEEIPVVDHLNVFQGLLNKLSNMGMVCGFVVLYQILGKFLGCFFVNPLWKILFQRIQ